MEALGVDLGSNKAVMAVVQRGGIDIVLNETSGRATPVQVAYSTQERLMGDSVKSQIKKNLKSTVLFPTRLLGLNADCKEQIELEERFLTNKVVTLDNKKIGFEVVQMGEKYTFTVEQIMAFYLRRIKKFYEKADYKSKDIVLTVPSYASNVERQAILDASRIAGLNCLRVLNESTAIALNYGFFRKQDLDPNKPRTVAFVDLGHSKTTITIASFVQGKTKIFVHNSDRNLGARDFDYEIFQVLGEEFKKKFDCDPRNNVKCKLRMLEGIEKARKVLSGNTETSIYVDYLMEEEDLQRNLKREEFEQMIDPLLRRFTELIKATIQLSGLSTDDIDSVEMVGDATRTPIILELTKQVFNKSETFRTLNSLECIGRGASLQSAMLSPLFSVSSFSVEEYNSLPVSITYQFAGEEKVVTKELFKRGSTYPVTKSITFDNKLGDMNLLLHYTQGTEGLLKGLPDQIAQYAIKKGKQRHADAVNGGSTCKFTLRMSNNIHQVPCLENVELTEEWQEEEKIQVKKPVAPTAPKSPEKKPEGDAQDQAKGEAPAEGQAEAKPEAPQTEQATETRMRKKSASSAVNYDAQHHALTQQLLADFTKVEETLHADDRKFLDWKEARNDLEGYSYEMRNNLEPTGHFYDYADEATRTAFLANINETVAWIYADGQNAPLSDYTQKLTDFRTTGEPIKQRYRYYSSLNDYIELFKKTVGRIEGQAAAIEHLSEEQKQSVAGKIAAAKETFDKAEGEAASKPKHESPSFTMMDFERKIELLKAETNAIFTAPPPKPKEEAPASNDEEKSKADEPAASSSEQEQRKPEGDQAEAKGADSEMKDETPSQ